MPSPKAEAGLKDSMIEAAVEEQKDIVVETKTSSVKAIGEQILNNRDTILSKSLTHSQLGGQESENMRRL